MLWTAEFEVTNIIKDIAINAKNMGDTRIVEPNQPVQKVLVVIVVWLTQSARLKGKIPRKNNDVIDDVIVDDVIDVIDDVPDLL